MPRGAVAAATAGIVECAMGSVLEATKVHSWAGAAQPETIRLPEVEEGVGCDFDSYLLTPDHSLDDRIARTPEWLGCHVLVADGGAASLDVDYPDPPTAGRGVRGKRPTRAGGIQPWFVRQ